MVRKGHTKTSVANVLTTDSRREGWVLHLLSDVYMLPSSEIANSGLLCRAGRRSPKKPTSAADQTPCSDTRMRDELLGTQFLCVTRSLCQRMLRQVW